MIQLKNLFFIILFSSLFLGCSSDETYIEKTIQGHWDASSTVVVNKTIEYADGVSQGVIKLQVYNKQGVLMPGLLLDSLPNLPSVHFVNCTVSDANGILYCNYTSTAIGNSDIDFTNGTQSFETDISFVSLPTKLETTRVSSSKILLQEPTGYKVTTGLRKTQGFINNQNGYLINTETPTFKLNHQSP